MLYIYFQGIEYLVENDLLPNTPEEVAKFLYQGEGLNKTAIGDYLGEKYASVLYCVIFIMKL